jgi:hypothetical protein
MRAAADHRQTLAHHASRESSLHRMIVADDGDAARLRRTEDGGR